MLKLDCDTCKKKMIIHPDANEEDRRDIRRQPKYWNCDECAPLKGRRIFLDYNEYLQKKSIEVWK